MARTVNEPTPVTITREQIEQGIEDFIDKEKAINNLKRVGLPIPTRPVDMESVQHEWDALVKRSGGIGNVPFEKLGDFLDRWTAVVSYARWLEAMADVDQTVALEIRDHIKKQLYLIQSGSNRELRDAAVYAEPKYIEWELKYTTAVAHYKLIKQLREGYEHRCNAVSREITRRVNDVMSTQRAINRGQNA